MSERLPLWRRLRRRVWYAVLMFALGTVRMLPPAAGRGFCRGLAILALRCRRRERTLARANLALAYPRRDRTWREALLRESAAAQGENLYAALTADRQAGRGFPDVVAEAGPDGRCLPEVLASLQAGGRGVLLVMGHLGCWELLGAWLAARLDRTAVITATVRNPAVDRWLQARRRSLGLRPLPREGGVRPVLRELSRGAVVGALVDQNLGPDGAAVPFLGRPAPTALGLLRLAARQAVPLVPAAMVRQQGRWVVRHLEPIQPHRGEDAAALAGRCNRALGRLVRRNPDQWVWFHDRWGLERARRSQ